MICKISKILCCFVTMLSIYIIYIKTINGECINEQIIWLALLFVAYKLTCYGERQNIKSDKKESIEKILKKYHHNGECYMAHRFACNQNNQKIKIQLEDELKEYCEENHITYKYACRDAYDSYGYSCSVGIIAIIDENSEIQLITVLYEYFGEQTRKTDINES